MASDLPKTVTVCCDPWKVIAVRRVSFTAFDGGGAVAECDVMRHVIRIAVGPRNKPVSERVVRKRLYHELFHAVNALGEEMAAEIMADVLEDNDLVAVATALTAKPKRKGK